MSDDFQTQCSSKGVGSDLCRNTFAKPESSDLCTELQTTSVGSQTQERTCAIENNLPSEIIRLILERAVPPYSLLDTSLAAGFHSAWCDSLRLLKSITLVCHSWYFVGVQFLYANVCIRRITQLESLYQALANSTLQQLCLLVKYLELQCFIPEDLSCKFAANLDAVIKLCPTLSKFAYVTPMPLPPNTIRPASLAPQITHLRLDGTVHYDALVAILQEVRASLFALQVKIDYDEYMVPSASLQQFTTTGDIGGSAPALSRRQILFPVLHTLSVTDPSRRTQSKVLRILEDLWVMPLLRRATIYPYNTFPYSNRCPTDDLEDNEITSNIASFLSVHGHGLLFLHIGFPYIRFPPTAFHSFLEYCPLLERLIIHPSTFERIYWMNNRLYHANLRWLDLTHYFDDYVSYQPSLLCLAKEQFPKLLQVRHICNLPGYLFNWLDDFHPTPDHSFEYFALEVFDRRLVSLGGLVFHWTADSAIPSGEHDGESTDSDYIPTSEESSDTESELSDDFVSGDEQVIPR